MYRYIALVACIAPAAFGRKLQEQHHHQQLFRDNPAQLFGNAWALLSEHYVDRSKYTDAEWNRLHLKWERRFKQNEPRNEREARSLVRELLFQL